MKDFFSSALDVLFPFRCVARNTRQIDKLAADKRKTFAAKTAASNRLRTTIRRAVVDSCDEPSMIRRSR